MGKERSRFREKLISGIKQGFSKLGPIALQVGKGALLAGLLGTAALPILLAGVGLDPLTKALSDFVGSQGANLISNRLETFFVEWRKKKGKAPNETEITEYIKQEMQHEAEFREQVLDLLGHTLEGQTASIFKDVLASQDDVATLVVGVQRELNQLKEYNHTSVALIYEEFQHLAEANGLTQQKLDEANTKLDEAITKLDTANVKLDTLVQEVSNIRKVLDSLAPQLPAISAVSHPIPSVSGVVGRERELEEIAARFGHASATTIVSEPQSSASLLGVAGIGKSTLAAYYCHHYKDKYARICWRDLSRDYTISGLVAAFAALIGADFDPRAIPNADNQALQLVAWLQAASHPCLVVLDNLETVLGRDGQPNQPGWAALLASAASIAPSHLLITSRLLPSDDAGNELDPYRLGGLSDEAGADLLSRKIQLEQRAGITAADLTLATQKAGGHPQALGFLGQLVNGGYPLPALLADTTLWHGDIATKLLNKIWNDDNLLTEDDRLLLEYVSIYERPAPLQFRQPVSADELARMLMRYRWTPIVDGWKAEKPNNDDEQARTSWQQHKPKPTFSAGWQPTDVEIRALALSRRSLLNVEAGRYTMHAIVRDYAYKKLADPPAHHCAAATHFRSLYTRDAHTDPPHRVAEVQPLLDAFDQLCAAGEWMAASELMLSDYFLYEGNRGKTLHELLNIWGETNRIVGLLGRLASPSAADQLPPKYLGVVLGNLGVAYNDLGDARGAIGYYERILKTHEQTGDLHRQGTTLGNLGLAFADLGEVRTAIDYYERALKIAEQVGDLLGQGNHLGNLGLAYADLGEVRTAIGYHQRALKIAEQIDDLRGQGNRIGNLGNAYFELGEVRTAIGYYERALKIGEQIGDLPGQGGDLGNLANAYNRLGEIDKALELYTRAIAIRQQIGDLRGEATDWNNLGVLHKNAGHNLEALTCYLRALSIRRRIEDPKIKSTVTNIIILRRDVGEAAWPALVQQAAAALATEGVAQDDALLAEALNIAPAAAEQG